jgi:hypothetical protein
MSLLGNARDALFTAATDSEKEEAISAYYEAIRERIATDVGITLDNLMGELGDQGNIVILTLKLAADRVAQVLAE